MCEQYDLDEQITPRRAHAAVDMPGVGVAMTTPVRRQFP
jgi:hypothetical protein